MKDLIQRLEGGETGQHIDWYTLYELGARQDVRGDWRWNANERVKDEELRPSRSLDACRALRERVLPGWSWARNYQGEFWVRAPDRISVFYGFSPSGEDAASYLIALLKVKLAELEAMADEDNHRAELEEQQHQEEMRELENREMEEHFRRHPHG